MSAPSSPRPAKKPTRLRQSLARWVGDWFGIMMLFVLWLGMVIVMTHIVVIPRTCAQRWPGFIPLIGNLRSMLPSGGTLGPECLSTGPRTSSLPAIGEAMTTYIIPDGAFGFALALVALSATPLVLSFGAALIAKWQQAPRARHRFAAEREKPAPDWSPRERTWKLEVAEHIQKLWTIESRRSLQAQHRMMQHACMFGFAGSAILGWGLIINNSTALSTQTRMITVAMASAAFTSFCLSFGRISVRASIRDSSARMFAYALRGIITSVLAAILFCVLLWHHNSGGAVAGATQALKDSAVLSEQPFKGPTSFMMIGMLVALIGEGILSQLTARAASAVNLSITPSSDGVKQLSAIDGLTDQDMMRLGEEGIDSIHALAMSSTAYLYFSTPYTLQRICDWQDQALLITYVGLAKAQTCREKLMIRGAIDLQRKSEFIISASSAKDEAERAAHAPIFEIIRSSLGFISIEQARESLYPLANDETIRRLRIYQRGVVSEDPAPLSGTA